MSALLYLALALVAGAVAAWRLRRVPYAAVACALAALVLAVLVSLPLNDKGPRLLEVAVLPAAAGALLGALAMRAGLARLSDRVE